MNRFWHNVKSKIGRSVVSNTYAYQLECEKYLAALLKEERYQNDLRLNKHGYKIYSQFDEDGIIQEILRRIGLGPGHFLEIGFGDGNENNTAFLLMKGWKGIGFEAGNKNIKTIRKNCSSYIESKRLTIRREFVNAENIEPLIKSYADHEKISLLSIDIDSNDYWVWQAITCVTPAVVVIEYNAMFPPAESFTVAYDPERVWNGTTYSGSSLKALEKLGAEKGYKLVGCSTSGVNAFFVRDDLAADHFLSPHTAEEHYEPIRSFLTLSQAHPPEFGEWVKI